MKRFHHFQKMKSTRSIPLFFAVASTALIFLGFTPEAKAALLTFDDPEFNQANTTIHGVEISAMANDGGIFDISSAAGGNNIRFLGSNSANYTGSSAISTTSAGSFLTFTPEGGKLFTLNSIDIAPSIRNNGLPIDVIGTLSMTTSSGVVTRDFDYSYTTFSNTSLAVGVSAVSSFTVSFASDGSTYGGGSFDNIKCDYTQAPSGAFTADFNSAALGVISGTTYTDNNIVFKTGIGGGLGIESVEGSKALTLTQPSFIDISANGQLFNLNSFTIHGLYGGAYTLGVTDANGAYTESVVFSDDIYDPSSLPNLFNGGNQFTNIVSARITDFYGDAFTLDNVGITIGAVPEPVTTGLIGGMALLVLAACRRRQTQEVICRGKPRAKNAKL